MLSNGQPIEQAPHSMQLPELTSVFFCSAFHSYTPAGQKWVQYLPLQSLAQTAWSTISLGEWTRLSGRPTPTGSTVGTPRSVTIGCIGPVAGTNGHRTGSPWSSLTQSITVRATADLGSERAGFSPS